ncbi:MAG: HD domain-containing protein [Chloroflexi bacterium]|nr:HD domain-containing protein [Chloroflexota bacterium]
MTLHIGDRLAQQLAFLNEIEKLKLVYRRNKTVDQSRYENSAEHSWHVALMALMLAEHTDTPSMDLFKVLKMLLIHDLVEIYAGDTWLYDAQAALVQAEHETLAAQRLFALLPADQAAEFHTLWQEFDARATPEAAFAAAIDGLQPLLNHLLSGDPADQAVLISRADVLRRKQHIETSSHALWNVAQTVIEESTQRGLYHAEPPDG